MTANNEKPVAATLAQIVAALSVTYTDAGVVTWLNASRSAFGGASAMDLIAAGGISEVADLVIAVRDVDPADFVISERAR